MRGFLALAGTRQPTTTAEGIETDLQVATLRRRGSVARQGVLFARPPTAERIGHHLGDRRVIVDHQDR